MYPAQFDLNTGDIRFCDSTSVAGEIMAIGYRVTDNFIYGIDNDQKAIFRIDALGNAELLSPLKVSTAYVFDGAAVSPDGKYLVVMGSLPDQGVDNDDPISLLSIELGSGEYTQTATPLFGKSGAQPVCEDIAFHPVTGELFGFDVHANRLVTIHPDLQLIDDVSFPVQEHIANAEALFFDPFGQLFFRGRPPRPAFAPTNPDPNFYTVDLVTGVATFFAPAPLPNLGGDTDACSCPNIVAMELTIAPDTIFPCTEATVKFRIGNQTGIVQNGIRLELEFPAATTIREVLYNPFGGDLGTSIGNNQLSILGLSIPNGGDSILIRIDVGELPYGVYDQQAQLLGVDQPYRSGNVVLSNNPATCIYQDTTPLQIIPLFVDLGDQAYFCEGETTVLDAFLGDGVSYLWNDGSTDPRLEVTSPGQYAVTVSTPCETAAGSVTINYARLELDLGQDRRIDLGDEITITPSVISTGNLLAYQWYEMGDTLLADHCGACEQLTTAPAANVSYSLQVTDEFGCTTSDQIQVLVERNYKLFLPNAFSPNNDGINDYLFPQAKHDARLLSFQVFDRWGATVFSAKDAGANEPMSGWDGHFKNKKMERGIYVWSVEVEFFDGEIRRFSGDVLLVN